MLADYAESGSEEAFGELVTAYIGMVYGSALRLVDGDSQLAEDVAQRVFTDLARQAMTLSPQIMVGGWLHRRTCQVAATAMRGERRRLIREKEACEMNSLGCDEALADVGPVLDEAINQLPAEDRDAIVLRFFDRYNLRDVGEAMGTSEAAAQKRVERALEKLRGLLLRRGVVLSATALALAVESAAASAAPAGLAATISTAALASAPASAGITLTTMKILTMLKLNMTLTAVVATLMLAGTATTIILTRHQSSALEQSYTPPPNMSMQQLLNEAQADAAAGRYKEALAKQIWFRDNALKREPSMVGVRDSFALMYWAQLAQKYPPAMTKLASIRDQAIKTVFSGHTEDRTAARAYLTAVSINNGLNESSKNVELFKALDAHDPAAAKQVYSVAEKDLIAAKEYALCGHYIDADRSYAQVLANYNRLKDMPKSQGTPQLLEMAGRMFTSKTATLVALLAINNRNDEAERVATQAAQENDTPESAALLAEAKTGKLPPAWP